MTTPTKNQILEKAIELFHNDNKQFITPEEEELKEAGYFSEAQAELMQGENSEALSYIEQQAHDLGFRLIPEKQHGDIIYYQVKYEKLREKIKRIENHVIPVQQTPAATLTPKEPEAAPSPEIETEEIETETQVKQPSLICTSIKAKLRNLGTILKLIGEICYLKLRN